MTRDEKVAEAQRLRRQGLKYRQIAERTGIAISTAQAYVKDPDGLQLKARKDSYRGTCEECGGPTTGCNGRDKAPSLCSRCHRASVTKTERNERMLEMWEAGIPTSAIAKELHETEQVIRGYIEKARRLKGLPITMRRSSGNETAERYRLIAQRVRAGFSNEEIADELETTPASVNTMQVRARRLGFDMPFRSKVAA